jgi:TPR repeat protein
MIGQMYLKGIGGPQDSAQARKWYEKAARQGHAQAQVSLGIMYSQGLGGPEDTTQGLNWIAKSAEQGNKGAKAIMKKLREKIEAGLTDPGYGEEEQDKAECSELAINAVCSEKKTAACRTNMWGTVHHKRAYFNCLRNRGVKIPSLNHTQ